MALLLTSVFGVTGCGSDDDVQVESRVKNVAPEASGVSDAPSKADCEFLEFLDLNRLRIDRLLDDLLDLDLVYDLVDQCDAVSKSGNYAPEASGVSDAPSSDDCYIRDLLDALLNDRSLLRDLNELIAGPDFALVPLYDVYADQCNAWIESGADSVTTTTVPPAPETSGVSDGPSEDDCFRDLRDLRDLLDLRRGLLYSLDLLDRLDDLDLRLDLRRGLLDRLDDLDLRLDLRDLLDRLDGLDRLLDQCDAASKSETKSPEGDDVDRG
jgi:hypothetical protein